MVRFSENKTLRNGRSVWLCLKRSSFKTVSKQSWNCSLSVSFRCTGSFSVFRLPASASKLYSVYRFVSEYILSGQKHTQQKTNLVFNFRFYRYPFQWTEIELTGAAGGSACRSVVRCSLAASAAASILSDGRRGRDTASAPLPAPATTTSPTPFPLSRTGPVGTQSLPRHERYDFAVTPLNGYPVRLTALTPTHLSQKCRGWLGFNKFLRSDSTHEQREKATQQKSPTFRMNDAVQLNMKSEHHLKF